jgi:putative membrane protein
MRQDRRVTAAESSAAVSRPVPVAHARRESVVLLALVLAGLVLSGIGPKERVTWLLEVFPVLIGVPLLVLTRRRFPLTPLTYRLLALHAVVLMVGGHWTYAGVPLGEWVKDWTGGRNDYDKLGHFAQGFVPAILAREILLRCSPLRPGRWLAVLTVSVCLAFSAFYEMVEWWAAVLGGSGADAFLGTQGYVFDTQSDMFCALLGAATALALLGRVHDRQLGLDRSARG